MTPSPLVEQVREALERQRDKACSDYYGTALDDKGRQWSTDHSAVTTYIKYHQEFKAGADSRTEIILKLVEAHEKIMAVSGTSCEHYHIAKNAIVKIKRTLGLEE